MHVHFPKHSNQQNNIFLKNRRKIECVNKNSTYDNTHNLVLKQSHVYFLKYKKISLTYHHHIWMKWKPTVDSFVIKCCSCHTSHTDMCFIIPFSAYLNNSKHIRKYSYHAGWRGLLSCMACTDRHTHTNSRFLDSFLSYYVLLHSHIQIDVKDTESHFVNNKPSERYKKKNRECRIMNKRYTVSLLTTQYEGDLLLLFVYVFFLYLNSCSFLSPFKSSLEVFTAVTTWFGHFSSKFLVFQLISL